MNLFPRARQVSVALYHVPTTSTSGKKSYPASADVTISAGMLPMDVRQHALEGGDYVDPHELYCEGTANILAGDKAIIDSVTYYVKKVFSANFGGIPHKRASISTQT